MKEHGSLSVHATDDKVEITAYFDSDKVPGVTINLATWWMRTAQLDLLAALPKASEYGGSTGSADLELVGDNIAKLMDWEGVPSPLLQEIGCWFYLQGKVARLVSDYQQRRPGKTDTLHDGVVYLMMMRRLQEHGRWP